MSLAITRQRSIAKTGNIRMGEKKTSKTTGKEYPAQRETFRLTSANQSALQKLALAYGGKVTAWKDHPGEFELVTTSNQISVLVDTELSVDETFQLYDGKTRTRRCDGLNCRWIELKRSGKEITDTIDHGIVPCLCDPEGQEEDLPDEDRKCELVTNLRVMVPATDDVTLWQFQSRGKIFNAEVFGVIDAIRSMGIRHGYCHLTINIVTKTIGAEVSKFGVARLTLDPNPPDMVRALMANTPAAQAKRLMEGSQMLPQSGAQQLPAGSKMLPPPARQSNAELAKQHGLDADQYREITERVKQNLGDIKVSEFLEGCKAAGKIGFAALLAASAPERPEEAEIVTEEPTAETPAEPTGEIPDPFADAQEPLL